MRLESISGAVLRRAGLALALATLSLSPVFGLGPGPSMVSIAGHQLVVQKRNLDGSLAPAAPYAIRGVVWSPASKDTTTSTGDRNNACSSTATPTISPTRSTSGSRTSIATRERST